MEKEIKWKEYGRAKGWLRPNDKDSMRTYNWYVRVAMPDEDRIAKGETMVFIDHEFCITGSSSDGKMWLGWTEYNKGDEASILAEQLLAYNSAMNECRDELELMGFEVELY